MRLPSINIRQWIVLIRINPRRPMLVVIAVFNGLRRPSDIADIVVKHIFQLIRGEDQRLAVVLENLSGGALGIPNARLLQEALEARGAQIDPSRISGDRFRARGGSPHLFDTVHIENQASLFLAEAQGQMGPLIPRNLGIAGIHGKGDMTGILTVKSAKRGQRAIVRHLQGQQIVVRATRDGGSAQEGVCALAGHRGVWLHPDFSREVARGIQSGLDAIQLLREIHFAGAIEHQGARHIGRLRTQLESSRGALIHIAQPVVIAVESQRRPRRRDKLGIAPQGRGVLPIAHPIVAIVAVLRSRAAIVEVKETLRRAVAVQISARIGFRQEHPAIVLNIPSISSIVPDTDGIQFAHQSFAHDRSEDAIGGDIRHTGRGGFHALAIHEQAHLKGCHITHGGDVRPPVGR